MFHQKRRSMLGRRHLMAQQQAQNNPAQSQRHLGVGNGEGAGSSNSMGRRGEGASWRGRQSAKKKTPPRFDKASREFKKCLFSKSPGVNYLEAYNSQVQDRKLYSPNGNLLNETGIASIAPTPGSSSRSVSITPSSAHRRRVEMEKSRYGGLLTSATSLATSACVLDKPIPISRPVILKPTSSIYDIDNLKPPAPPGPSRLEKLLLEEKSQKSSSYDFNNLQLPASPGPSRLDKLIMEEKLEQPLDPDLKKIQTLSLDDPNTRLQFSPPLSSTCIGSPDSGKKNTIVVDEIKQSVLGSGRKLSTIKEDCDVSIIEFELNERTINELDDTMKENTVNNTMLDNTVKAPGKDSVHCKFDDTFKMCPLNNTTSKLDSTVKKFSINNTISNSHDITSNTTVKPNKFNQFESFAKGDHNSNHKEGWEVSYEAVLSRLDKMELAVMSNAENNRNILANLRRQIENLQENCEKECQEYLSNIRSMKNTFESVKHMAGVAESSEDKENTLSFKVPICKKKQLDEEGKWLNSVKAENPGLLKTPNLKRRQNQSAVWTPHSLTKVLHDQMNELYD